MIEKLYRIDFNWANAENYQYFIVGEEYNGYICTNIVEIERYWCRVMLVKGEGKDELIEFHNITNLNRLYFKK